MCESMRLYTERIMKEGEINTLIQLLSHRFGKLSESIIDKIQNSSKEQLNKLIIKVLDIQNEDDLYNIFT